MDRDKILEDLFSKGELMVSMSDVKDVVKDMDTIVKLFSLCGFCVTVKDANDSLQTALDTKEVE